MNRLIVVILFLLSSQLGYTQEQISLVTPYDGDTIETKNPLLSWVYMDGGLSNSRVSYRIIIVELEDEQSAEAGIIVNQPMVLMNNLQSSQLFYPYDAPELEGGHRYGWQIHKIENNVLMDKSEAWEFILPLPIIPDPVYYKMKSKNDGVIYDAINGKLFFYFNENYNNDALSFYLYDDKNELVDASITLNPELEEADQEINVKKTGANFYSLDLGEYAFSGVYRLLIRDNKGHKYELKFFVK